MSIVRYELSPQEILEGRSRLADGFVACTCRDREALTALQALSDALCEDNQAPLKLPFAEERTAGITLLRHELHTNGITYLNFYFVLDDLAPDKLTKASFMAWLFGYLETSSYALTDLHREMRSLFGSIQFAVEAYGQQNIPTRCRSFLCVTCSVLDAKLEKALSFLTELLMGQRWDDPERVLVFLHQHRSAMAEQAVMAGGWLCEWVPPPAEPMWSILCCINGRIFRFLQEKNYADC